MASEGLCWPVGADGGDLIRGLRRGSRKARPSRADRHCNSPVAEIAHPADAARIALQFITETGHQDSDVWLDTSRILVPNMISTLWKEGNGTLPALLDALRIKSNDAHKTGLTNPSSARPLAQDPDRAPGPLQSMPAPACHPTHIFSPR